MILVAITACLIWGGNKLIPWARTMWSGFSTHRRLADFLLSHPRLDRENAKRHEARAQALMKPDGPQDGALLRQAQQEMREAEYYRRLAEYHVELERVNRKIAARPWASRPLF